MKKNPTNRKWKLSNFHVKEQGAYLEASDFAGLWKMKVHKGSVLGLTLLFLCNQDPNTADIYVKLLWAISNITPDGKYLEDLWQCYKDRLARMPKEAEQTDEEALQEIQSMEALMNMPEEDLNAELKNAQQTYEEVLKAGREAK